MERFIEVAASDPQTVAIKMTVYRVGDDTPFVRSLIRAAEAGKQVACIVEVKARFDEARNLHWAQELAKVGAHVVYGVLGPQDAHEARAGGPQGSRRPALLRAHRHRELSRPDGAPLHRRRPVHLRPGADRRRRQAVPLLHRPLARAVVRQAARRADEHAGAFPRADRARDRARPQQAGRRASSRR